MQPTLTRLSRVPLIASPLSVFDSQHLVSLVRRALRSPIVLQRLCQNALTPHKALLFPVGA